MRRHAGFTLLEMLIVVALIAVLVAIAIPVFASQLASAREATCQANQRSLKAAVSVAYMSNGNDKQAAAESSVASMGMNPNDLEAASDATFSISAGSLCPESGTYTITFAENSIEIRCSKHATSKLLGEDGEVMNQLGETLKNKFPSQRCDSSGGTGGYTIQLLASLKDNGIDLEALGATSWAWRPSINGSQPKFYWSSVNIADDDMKDKKDIPLMSYNPDTGKYMVYKGTVGTRAGSNGNIYTSTKPVSAEGKSYDEAYAEYQNLMSTYLSS